MNPKEKLKGQIEFQLSQANYHLNTALAFLKQLEKLEGRA